MLRRAIFSNARAIRASSVTARTSAALRAQQRVAAAPWATTRWYSAEAKEEAKQEGKEEGKEAKPEENGEVAELKKKLEAKDKEVIDLKVSRPLPLLTYNRHTIVPSFGRLVRRKRRMQVADTPIKDKYVRTVAEFRTLQDRAARDQKAASNFAIQKFAKDLLEPVDNLDRALANVSPDSLATPECPSEHHTQLAALHEGLKMTESILMSALAQHGIEKVAAEEGGKFDAAVHDVTVAVPGKEDGIIMAIESTGYTLNGRLLRPAKVVASKKA